MIEKYLDPKVAFVDKIPDERKGYFVQVVILREAQSHLCFTTEGRILNTAILEAGYENPTKITRVVMLKRKQVAPERREGKLIRRRLIQEQNLQVAAEESKNCSLIENLCSKCPDCLLYGFAAQGGDDVARKSRVITDSAFSVQPYEQIVEELTLNAVDEITHTTKSALSSREYVKPGVVFPCVETFADVTKEEFLYLLINILYTTRYGAEASRIGTMKNKIVGIYATAGEVFTNLELTKHFYDKLSSTSFDLNNFMAAYPEIEQKIISSSPIKVYGILSGQKLEVFLNEFCKKLNEDDKYLIGIFNNVEQKVKEYLESKSQKEKKSK
ncbi:type I-D CRISPR-associated protein Cas7/Csc2 [Caldicellulosiruptor acetigenus]|uniref:CRISPR-associated protein Csc2 n=1 Tax=Caldicellulosiruptor acetigenus 6A TaxID=632516 RepID=G2PT71_9FIRM|nr:type I-D CRISPR-associated protein Cas7/Csc2 [Caldicellulosiruptor acetigenus]AEM74230.1 CRISPR-associated protein Csc2 [Caldicellulosiruptor acetigenus 6A]